MSVQSPNTNPVGNLNQPAKTQPGKAEQQNTKVSIFDGNRNNVVEVAEQKEKLSAEAFDLIDKQFDKQDFNKPKTGDVKNLVDRYFNKLENIDLSGKSDEEIQSADKSIMDQIKGLAEKVKSLFNATRNKTETSYDALENKGGYSNTVNGEGQVTGVVHGSNYSVVRTDQTIKLDEIS